MAVITVKNAADRCGILPKNIHTYKTRGKIIIRADGLIDDSNPVNIDFFNKYEKVDQTKVRKPIKDETIDTSPYDGPDAVEVKKTKSSKNKDNPKPKEQDYSRYVSTTELNNLKAEKTRWEIEILKLKNKVQSGDLIPISAAENVTSVHFNSITAVFFNAIDNEISDICNELGIERDRLTTIRGKLRKILNENVLKAKEKSKQDLIAAAENYEEIETEQQNESKN